MESKLRFNRSCNPLKIANHKNRSGLRRASVKLQNSWNLSSFDYLCTACRKKLSSIKSVASTSTNFSSDSNGSDNDENVEDDNDENIEDDNDENVEHNNSDTETNEYERSEPISGGVSFCSGSQSISGEELTQTISQLSLNTQLPVINDALALLNISPLDRFAIDRPSYLRGKYNEICSILAKLLELDNVSNHYENSVNYHEILENLKDKFKAENTPQTLKVQILTLLPSDWSINKICDVMGATKHMAILSKSLKERKGILSELEKKQGRPLSSDIKRKVIEFYESDEVSVNLPGKKDCLSIAKDGGKKKPVQKKLILCNLTELYKTFKEQHPDNRIGLSSFASLRPLHCVLAGSSGTHTICVCAIHQNVKLMIIGSNLAKLTNNSAICLTQYKDCFKLILCPNSSSACYLMKCPNCPGIQVLEKLLETVFDENGVDDVTYKYWISNPRCSLENIIKASPEFIETFCHHIVSLLPHDFIAKEQSAFMKRTKESLQDNEFLAICDFAENYAFVLQNAAPGFHWNNNQATIFPVVIYFKQNSEITHRSLVIISDNNNHDAIAVYVYLKIVTDFVKESFPTAVKIIYFSDGAPQQFKNFKNFVNIYYHKDDFHLDAEWHYFATAHGKGPCDGIGGTVKRIAARSSLQRPVDNQITTPQELYRWAAESGSLPNIAVKFSPENDYLTAKEKLDLRYHTAKSITGTQKVHSIVPMSDGNVRVKEYSSSTEDRIRKIFKTNRK